MLSDDPRARQGEPSTLSSAIRATARCAAASRASWLTQQPTIAAQGSGTPTFDITRNGNSISRLLPIRHIDGQSPNGP
jgi:hypothetical protein